MQDTKRSVDKIAIIDHIPQELSLAKDGRVLSGGSDRTWVRTCLGECRVFAWYDQHATKNRTACLQWARLHDVMIIWEVPDI